MRIGRNGYAERVGCDKAGVERKGDRWVDDARFPAYLVKEEGEGSGRACECREGKMLGEDKEVDGEENSQGHLEDARMGMRVV